MKLTEYDDWESVSLSMNPQFMAVIERSRASAKAHGTISLDEARRKYSLKPKAAHQRRAR